MKQVRISSSESSGCLSFARFLAAAAATSIGGSIGRMLSLRKGNLSVISLTITGQAELITGFRMPGVDIYVLV